VLRRLSEAPTKSDYGVTTSLSKHTAPVEGTYLPSKLNGRRHSLTAGRLKIFPSVVRTYSTRTILSSPGKTSTTRAVLQVRGGIGSLIITRSPRARLVSTLFHFDLVCRVCSYSCCQRSQKCCCSCWTSFHRW